MTITYPKTIDIIGLPVAATNYHEAIEWIHAAAMAGDRAYALEAANTHVAALARHEPDFGKVMAQFDLVCPDGMPLVWMLNHHLQGEEKLTDRVYGPTLMLKTIEASEQHQECRHFFFGGTPETLKQLEKRFSKDYPHAPIAGSYSPPFGAWPEDEFERICEQIVASKANLVWVGLGCPKQERWIAEHKDRLPPAVYFGIGAAFAFHAGEVKQAPGWIQRCGVEWLYRLCREPRRLFRRYFTYNSLFLWYAIHDQMKN
ncbi:MAG: WecB/TagA/CpsF family glycosyltransferase [Akkermansiaceae bacterium]